MALAEQPVATVALTKVVIIYLKAVMVVLVLAVEESGTFLVAVAVVIQAAVPEQP